MMAELNEGWLIDRDGGKLNDDKLDENGFNDIANIATDQRC